MEVVARGGDVIEGEHSSYITGSNESFSNHCVNLYRFVILAVLWRRDSPRDMTAIRGRPAPCRPDMLREGGGRQGGVKAVVFVLVSRDIRI